MFANHAFSNDTVEVLSRLVSLYVKHPLGDLGVWTTSQLDNGMYFENDLAAIPDLAAGAVSELINSISPANVLSKGQFRNWPEGLTWKSAAILDWLAKSSPALKKACVVFDKAEESPRMWQLLLG
jgi:hypothetical protein